MEIKSLSEAGESPVRAFLREHGFSDEIIGWKYFDAPFNRGRERGLVALDGSRILGFLGLIPFTVGGPGGSSAAVWTCDWYADAVPAGGVIGLRLLREAFARHPLVAHIGGNSISRGVLGRLADHADPEGVRLLRLDLRLGSLLDRVVERLHLPRRLASGPLRAVPVRAQLWASPAAGARVEEGVSASIDAADDAHPAESSPRPAYDRAYVEWQVGRCPGLTSFSSVVAGTGDSGNSAPVVAVAWASAARGEEWRLALLGPQRDEAALRAAVERAVIQIQSRRGVGVSILASRTDAQLLATLNRLGFRLAGAYPSYVFSQGRPHPFTVGGASYLDVDNGYRFGDGPNVDD
jgi:hypothetical protein